MSSLEYGQYVETWSDNENCIDFLRGSKVATCYFTQRRFISRMKELAREHPEECEICEENRDGSIVARFPSSWVKISPPRKLDLTDEQRESLRERGKALLKYQGQ